jgi:hypothetical protein
MYETGNIRMMAALVQIGAYNDFNTAILTPKFIHPNDVDAVTKLYPKLDLMDWFKAFGEKETTLKPGCLMEAWSPSFLRNGFGVDDKL